jgi:hypothetical protein
VNVSRRFVKGSRGVERPLRTAGSYETQMLKSHPTNADLQRAERTTTRHDSQAGIQATVNRFPTGCVGRARPYSGIKDLPGDHHSRLYAGSRPAGGIGGSGPAPSTEFLENIAGSKRQEAVRAAKRGSPVLSFALIDSTHDKEGALIWRSYWGKGRHRHRWKRTAALGPGRVKTCASQERVEPSSLSSSSDSRRQHFWFSD